MRIQLLLKGASNFFTVMSAEHSNFCVHITQVKKKKRKEKEKVERVFFLFCPLLSFLVRERDARLFYQFLDNGAVQGSRERDVELMEEN